ncbi:MAG TPA: hypothetical protein VIM14_13270 [Polyangia bacterium]
MPSEVSGTEWHCNVVTLGRRPFFLLAHSLSLYAFFIPVAGNSSRESLGRAFRDGFIEALAREGVSSNAASKVMDAGPDSFCRAVDRRVLGTMVDHANMSRFVVEDAGFVDASVLAKIHDEINESPMSVLGMESPRRVLLSILLPGAAA